MTQAGPPWADPHPEKGPEVVPKENQIPISLRNLEQKIRSARSWARPRPQNGPNRQKTEIAKARTPRTQKHTAESNANFHLETIDAGSLSGPSPRKPCQANFGVAEAVGRTSEATGAALLPVSYGRRPFCSSNNASPNCDKGGVSEDSHVPDPWCELALHSRFGVDGRSLRFVMVGFSWFLLGSAQV